MAVEWRYGKEDREYRVDLLVKAPNADIKKLARFTQEQQWLGDWYIKRVDVVHPTQSRSELGKFGPAKGSDFNLFIGVKAKDQSIMTKKALPAIMRVLKLPDPEAYKVVQTFGPDW
jgi:hypothetical protein